MVDLKLSYHHVYGGSRAYMMAADEVLLYRPRKETSYRLTNHDICWGFSTVSCGVIHVIHDEEEALQK